MNQQFQAGDKVIVHASAFVAHSVRHNMDRSASRPATIVREMPHSMAEYGYREYELDSGVIVHEDRLTPAAE